jgi:pyruvate dehydrogenase kinase 2/3/4
MTISTQILERIKYYGGYPQTSVSLSQMVKFGQNLDPITLLKGTKFVHRELPVRLAHRVVELENLPHNLSAMPSIQTVKRWYTESFKDLMELPEYNLDSSFELEKSKYFTERPENLPMPEGALEYIQTITKTIELIKKRHDPTQMTIAQGIIELKDYRSKSGKCVMDMEERLPESIQAFLDRFYLSRIGIRMLIGQHVALTRSHFDPSSVPKDYVGIICTKTNIGQIGSFYIYLL